MKTLVNIVIFSIDNDILKTFLPRRDHEFIIPQTEIDKSISFEEMAREIVEENLDVANLGNAYLEQLYTFGGNTISISYFMLLPWGTRIAESKDHGEWFSIEDATSKLSPNYKKILKYGITRLRWKIEYTNVAYSLLPKEFTLTELQKVYETILGRALDKRNFRKRILLLDILRPMKKKRYLGKARPAEVYVFRSRKLTYVNII